MPNRKEKIVANKPSPCTECPKFKVCKSPCPEVERWISQDHVGGTSKILMRNGSIVDESCYVPHGDAMDFVDLMKIYHGEDVIFPDSDASEDAWDIILSLNLNKISLEFLDLYYRQGKRIRDIAIITGLSSSTIDRRHQQAKISIKKKIRRRKLWEDVISKKFKFPNAIFEKVCTMYFKDLISRKNIAEELGINAATVSKYIQKVVKNLIKRGLIDLAGKRV